jgi:hypothetical protein
VWFAWSVAVAQSTFCSSGGLPTETSPWDGQVDVPPDVVIALVFPDQGARCPPPLVDAALFDADGIELPVRVAPLDARAVQVIPDTPLAPTRHVLRYAGDAGGSGGYGYSAGEAELSFLVSDGAPSGGGGSIEDLDVHLRRWCGATFAGPSLTGRVALADPSGGLLRTRAVVDGVPGPWHTATTVTPDRTSERVEEAVPTGLHELCLDTQLVDLRGDVADEGPRACFTQRSCPAPPSGRGWCATVPAAGPAPLALAALAALARRRARRP